MGGPVRQDQVSDRANTWEVEQAMLMLGGWVEEMWLQENITAHLHARYF